MKSMTFYFSSSKEEYEDGFWNVKSESLDSRDKRNLVAFTNLS